MRCSICEGNVVNGRCAECGMLMPDERNRYHLNENMRDHKAHCETAKQREMYEKPGQQQTFPQKMEIASSREINPGRTVIQ